MHTWIGLEIKGGEGLLLVIIDRFQFYITFLSKKLLIILFTRNYFITKSHQQINVVANLLNVYNVGKVKKNLTINVLYVLLHLCERCHSLNFFSLLKAFMMKNYAEYWYSIVIKVVNFGVVRTRLNQNPTNSLKLKDKPTRVNYVRLRALQC